MLMNDCEIKKWIENNNPYGKEHPCKNCSNNAWNQCQTHPIDCERHKEFNPIDCERYKELTNLKDGWREGAMAMAKHLQNNEDFSQLKDGSSMFKGNTTLLSFRNNLSSLENGRRMFEDCSALTSFTSDLSNLENGECMFFNCKNLSSFTTNLSSLKDGSLMFGGCQNLTTFTSELNNLTNGRFFLLTVLH